MVGLSKVRLELVRLFIVMEPRVSLGAIKVVEVGVVWARVYGLPRLI